MVNFALKRSFQEFYIIGRQLVLNMKIFSIVKFTAFPRISRVKSEHLMTQAFSENLPSKASISGKKIQSFLSKIAIVNMFGKDFSYEDM